MKLMLNGNPYGKSVKSTSTVPRFITFSFIYFPTPCLNIYNNPASHLYSNRNHDRQCGDSVILRIYDKKMSFLG